MFTPNSDSTIWMSQHNSTLIRPDNIFPIFCCPVVMNLCLLWPQLTPAVVYLLQSLTCIQRCSSAHLQVTSGYLCYCCLAINWEQSGHSPLTSDINKPFSPTELDIFSLLFSVNLRDGCVGKSKFLKIFRSTTMLHLKSLKPPLFYILIWASARFLDHVCVPK